MHQGSAAPYASCARHRRTRMRWVPHRVCRACRAPSAHPAAALNCHQHVSLARTSTHQIRVVFLSASIVGLAILALAVLQHRSPVSEGAMLHLGRWTVVSIVQPATPSVAQVSLRASRVRLGSTSPAQAHPCASNVLGAQAVLLGPRAAPFATRTTTHHHSRSTTPTRA